MCSKNHFCEDCFEACWNIHEKNQPGPPNCLPIKMKIYCNECCMWNMIHDRPDKNRSTLNPFCPRCRGLSSRLLVSTSHRVPSVASGAPLPRSLCVACPPSTLRTNHAMHVIHHRGKQLGMWKSKQTNSTPHPNTSWKIYLEPREWLMTQRNVALLPSWTNTQFMEKASAIPLHGKQLKGIMNNRFQSLQSSSTRNLCPVQNFIKSKGECIHQISSSCSVVPCAGPNTTKCFVKLNKGVARTK